MATKVKVGIIGCGGISGGHYKRLASVRAAKVVALCETNAKNLRRFAGFFPETEELPAFTDYREMIKRVDLDAVVICTPHTVHYEQIMYSLGRGLHVLIEKPMVCSIRHAKAVIKKAKAQKKVLAISYQRHFEPGFRYMKDLIAKGGIGKVQFVSAIQCQDWYKATRGSWRQDMSLSGGGQLNDSGSHLVDIVMWVTGLRIAEVYADIENFRSKVDINSSLTMRFTNGAQGSMSIVGNSPNWYEDHTIVGDKGVLYLRQGLGLTHIVDGNKQVKVRMKKCDTNHDKNFIDAVLGKCKSDVPAECGLRVIEVTEAAWRSAELGRTVKVK